MNSPPITSFVRFRMICAMAVAVCAASASAHDFWLRPSDFTPVAGDLVGVHIEIGHAGEAEPYARNPARIEKFVIVGPEQSASERPVTGSPGDEPAGRANVQQPGVSVIAYRSNHARNELEAAKFESYLAEEGLHEIIAKRNASGSTTKPGIEIYSRCAKSLVRAAASDHQSAATTPDPNAQRVIGMTLELIPVGDPTLARSGDSQRFRLLFMGKPYNGAQVELTPIDHAVRGHAHDHTIIATTDAQGIIEATLDEPGRWLLNTVVMQAAPSGSGADWESWWASLTFELAPK